MKKLAALFSIVGFLIQYIVPVILFGDVVPYTKEGFVKGLTGVGYIALGVTLYFIAKKLKEVVLQRKKSVWRGLILSLFPFAWWLIIFLCIGWITSFVVAFSHYWSKVLIFIFVGRAFCVASEAIHSTLEEGE